MEKAEENLEKPPKNLKQNIDESRIRTREYTTEANEQRPSLLS